MNLSQRRFGAARCLEGSVTRRVACLTNAWGSRYTQSGSVRAAVPYCFSCRCRNGYDDGEQSDLGKVRSSSWAAVGFQW
jgi:hypothetical protein